VAPVVTARQNGHTGVDKTTTARNVAYAGFLFCGVAALIISALEWIPMDLTTAQGVGFLVVLPLALAALPTAVVCVILGFRHWSDVRLLLLSILTILVVIEIATEAGSVAFYNAVPVVYAVVTTALCLTWFLVGRRRS
jgi:hypothetical protein